MGGFASEHARSLYLLARSRRYLHLNETLNKVGCRHGLEIAFPYLDRDLVSFLMAIPGDIHARNGVPEALLREANRDVLPAVIAERSWRADFAPAFNQGMARDLPEVARVLEEEGLAVRLGYLEGAALRHELASLHGLAQDVGWDRTMHLSELLALELWLQVFGMGKEKRASVPL